MQGYLEILCLVDLSELEPQTEVSALFQISYYPVVYWTAHEFITDYRLYHITQTDCMVLVSWHAFLINTDTNMSDKYHRFGEKRLHADYVQKSLNHFLEGAPNSMKTVSSYVMQ